MALAGFGAAGCDDDHRHHLFDPTPPGTPIGPGFASPLSLVVTSEATNQTLALLSVDEVTGKLGLAGGPVDLGAPIGDAETAAVAVDEARIYVGSDRNGVLGVVDVDAAGGLAPITGSPFPLEAPEPTVVLLNLASDVLYVGYRHLSFLSVYPVDATTGAIGAPEPQVPIACTFVETMRAFGDLLYVICNTTSNIVALRIEADGSLTDLGVNVATNPVPDYLDFTDDGAGNVRLYVSTSTSSRIEAYDVDTATGALTPLAGAPFRFPFLRFFELLRATDDGAYLAVGAESPPSVGLFGILANGSLVAVDADQMSLGSGGPEGIVWTPNGRFLFVANHNVGGIFVYERVGNRLFRAAVPRYLLPTGRPIDLVLRPLAVSP